MCRILLFAYGTLLDERVQRRVFGRVVEARPARLPGWRVVPRAVRGRYPGIARTAGEGAAGALLKVDSNGLARADFYEGTPKLYRRLRVSVQAGRRRLRCWVYVPAGAGLAGVASDRRSGLAGCR